MSALRERVLANLPEPLHSMRRWLLWRAAPNPKKPGKVRKIPHYANGRQRKGDLDTKPDVTQLVTLTEALDAFETSDRYHGIGFALVGGDNMVGLDLDDCLTKDRELIECHAGFDVACMAKAAGAYMERSPSGEGLRAIFQSTNTQAYSKDQVEAWGKTRFVTVTGDVHANPGSWVWAEGVREALGPGQNERQDAYNDGEDDGGGIIAPDTIADLRDALLDVSSESRELWVRLGYALRTLPGEKGRAIWLEWSRRSEKFDAADADRVWNSIPQFPRGTTHKVVFAEAQRNGWVNPKKGKKPVATEPEGDDDAFFIDLGPKELHPTEYIIDGFIQTGVSVIAGAWGSGKSLNILPLLASAAHLAPCSWGFRPIIRRKVVWVTEAPEQARDVLYSLSEAEGTASWDEIRDWFRLCRAHRRKPERLAKMLKGLVANLSYTLPNGFVVNPVVVLDTSAANLDIENESDNSLVSAALAILKQSLPGISIIVIGHTPKALVKADAQDATFRGASAWEADASATYFLIHDADTDSRYLAIRKCRFNPAYREIEFDHESGSKIIDTPWGHAQSKSYLHGVPTKSNGEARMVAKEAAKEGRREIARERILTDRQQRALDHIADFIADSRLPTRRAIALELGGKPELAYEALKRLVEAGTLEVHCPTRDQLKAIGIKPPPTLPEVVFPADADFTAFCAQIVTGNH